MFREMRLKEQKLTDEEAISMLEGAEYATLAIQDAEYPYSLPISFVYADGKIYFHGAPEGKKYDLIKKNNRVSLSVVGENSIQPHKYTMFYKSVVAFGTVRILEDEKEILKAMELTVERYSPGLLEGGRKFVN